MQQQAESIWPERLAVLLARRSERVSQPAGSREQRLAPAQQEPAQQEPA